MKKYTSPKNNDIVISPLGEERVFVSGNKNWRVDYAIHNGVRFEVGMPVTYIEDGIKYKGNIEWIILIDNGEVEVSISNTALGRVSLEDLIPL